MKAIDAGNLVLTPWCDETDCENDVKKRSGGKEEQKDEEAEDEEKAKEKEHQEQIHKVKQEMAKLAARLAQLEGTSSPAPAAAPAASSSSTATKEAAESTRGKETKAKKTQEEEEEEEAAKGFGLKAAAKTLCKPFDHPELTPSHVCFACGKSAKAWTLWGRSY